jgi:DNA helicase HerA-like ATPase
MMPDYEKLGVFYLGKEYDLQTKKATDALLLYDSKDLVTHAVVLGMTGSGKTGLCIGLIEEAAIDGIPSILIDPKGDMCDLLPNRPNNGRMAWRAGQKMASASAGCAMRLNSVSILRLPAPASRFQFSNRLLPRPPNRWMTPK